jgi:hypothetical protein
MLYDQKRLIVKIQVELGLQVARRQLKDTGIIVQV